ncbi:MAG: hypothetical protein QM756_18495 [Polyangiaceae bacterium]
MDLFTMLLLSCALGALVTAHVALVAGLATQKPRWRALLALLLPPLAPYWGLEARRFGWSAAWIAAALVYAGSLISSLF